MSEGAYEKACGYGSRTVYSRTVVGTVREFYLYSWQLPVSASSLRIASMSSAEKPETMEAISSEG